MKPIYDPSNESYVPIFNTIDEEGSTGSGEDAEKLAKEETKSLEKPIEQGMARATEDTSVQSQAEIQPNRGSPSDHKRGKSENS